MVITFEGFDSIFIGEVIAGVDDADALGPVDPEGRAKDVESGAAFVPLGRRFGLQSAVGSGADEPGLLDQLGGSFDQRRSQFHRGLASDLSTINN